MIESLRAGVPAPLVELRRLDRTPQQRAVAVLAFFDRPSTSNGPREPSTADWNTSTAQRSGSGTGPTASPGPSSNLTALDPS